MNSSVLPSTIEEWVYWAEKEFSAAGLFFGHGTDNAIDEAVYLISHALKTDFGLTGFDPKQTLTPENNTAIETLLKQRITTKKPVEKEV